METTAVALKDDYLNKSNERSVYNLVPNTFQQAMDRVDESYFLMSEEDLESAVAAAGGRKRSVSPVLNLLRYRLWDEFNKSVDKGTRITMKSVCVGICSDAYLRQAVFRNPVMVAWLLRPPVTYEDAALEALNHGMKQLRSILEFPLWDEKGRPNDKIAKLQIEVVKMLDARLKGAPVQKHEVQQKTMQINTTAKEIKEMVEHASMDDLEKHLKKLRGEEEKHQLLEERRPKLEEFKSQAIDVEPPPTRKVVRDDF